MSSQEQYSLGKAQPLKKSDGLRDKGLEGGGKEGLKTADEKEWCGWAKREGETTSLFRRVWRQGPPPRCFHGVRM